MKEINDQFGNLRVVALQSKMAAGHEMYLCIGHIARATYLFSPTSEELDYIHQQS